LTIVRSMTVGSRARTMCGSRTQPPGANSVSLLPQPQVQPPAEHPDHYTIGLDDIYLEYLQRLLGKRAKEGNSEYGRLPGVVTVCQAPLTSLRPRISGRNVRVTRWLWIGFFLH
jgi:hypothetical protein